MTGLLHELLLCLRRLSLGLGQGKTHVEICILLSFTVYPMFARTAPSAYRGLREQTALHRSAHCIRLVVLRWLPVFRMHPRPQQGLGSPEIGRSSGAREAGQSGCGVAASACGIEDCSLQAPGQSSAGRSFRSPLPFDQTPNGHLIRMPPLVYMASRR